MQKKIALLGEVLVDLILSENFTITSVPGGSIYNTASSLAKLGAEAGFFSQVGNDFWGKYLLSEMEKNGIDFTGVVKSDISKTPLAFAAVDDKGNANYDFYKSKFYDRISISNPGEIGIFHYGSYFSVLPENQRIIKYFTGALKNSIISYDPNYRNKFSTLTKKVINNFKCADIIKASFEDLTNLFGVKSLEAAFECLEKYKPILIIITLGEEGAAAKIAGRNYIKSDGVIVNVADTIGAGDNFSAGYIYYLYYSGIFSKVSLALIDDDFIKKMLTFANSVAAASLKVKGANVDKDILQDLKTNLK
jgi:fructokinase